MPTSIDANNALETVLNASPSQLVMLILLLGALIAILLAWSVNRAIRNQGRSASADDKVISTLIVDVGAAIRHNSDVIERGKVTIENNTKAMESLRDTHTQVLRDTTAIRADTGVIRHDTERLIDIKSQLDKMEVELSAIRVSVDTIIQEVKTDTSATSAEGKPNAGNP